MPSGSARVWIANGAVMPPRESALTKAAGTPIAANEVAGGAGRASASSSIRSSSDAAAGRLWTARPVRTVGRGRDRGDDADRRRAGVLIETLQDVDRQATRTRLTNDGNA